MAGIFQAAPPPTVVPNQMSVVPPGTFSTISSTLAIVESVRLSSVFDIDRRFVVAAFGQQGEPPIRAEVLSQGWRQVRAPEPAPAPA